MWLDRAQSVEQRTENPRVPGSIPGLATKNVLDNSKTFFLVECNIFIDFQSANQ